MTAEEFEAQLRKEGCEVVKKDLEPDKALPEHAHPWHVHAMVLAGEFTVETAQGSTTYREGESFRLNAGTLHHERHGPEGARLLLGRLHLEA